MTEQPSSQPIQNPLTLVMRGRTPEDFAELRRLLEQLQSLPQEENPIVAALNKIGTVHFARFSFIGDDRLAVITTYDGDFDVYINEFVNEIGDLFNRILAYVADAPPLPVQTYRNEFLDFVRSHDLGVVGTFYSAYPDRTVLDILEAAGRS